MKHLTAIYKNEKIANYGLYVSVPLHRAKEISNALDLLIDGKSNQKSKRVCDCVESGALEPIAQERVEHALALIDGFDDGLDECEKFFIADLRMALTGCPTTTNTEFTGELSPEYIERYGDE